MAKAKSKLRSLLSRILKKRPKLTRPKIGKSRETTGGGHRGIAARRIAKPDLSAQNVAKWQNLPASEVEAFVYEQEPLFVHSSNVNMFQYFIEDQALLVEFKGGKTYKYENVSEDEAIRAAKAQSKGAWVWDDLRVRGSKTRHKKPYAKVSSGFVNPRNLSQAAIDKIFSELPDEGQ